MRLSPSLVCAACLLVLAWTGRTQDVRAETFGLDFSKVPQVYPSETIKSSDPRIRPLFFAGAPYRGEPTRVFAWLGVPDHKPGETVPGIVLLHGGGGTAFESWVKTWADRGYAAIAIDHFGSLPLEGKPRPRNPQGGPEGGSAAFAKLGEPPEDQWPYHAVTAASRALSLLRAEPGVDPDRIGVTGISWGGYLTCVFAGVDPRLRFAIPVYGCGHYRDTTFAGAIAKQPAADVWWTRWDASNYLSGVRVPMLWVNGTNDKFFWLPAWQQSYREIPEAQRSLAQRVGMKHGHPPDGDPPEVLAFADATVRGTEPAPRILSAREDGRAFVVDFSPAQPVEKAELHYTTDSSGPWEKREWKTVIAALSPGEARADIPDDAAVYFLNLTDPRGLVSSTEHVVRPISTNP